MKYLIIDDEPIAHRIITGYAEKLSYLELAGHCYDALQAFDFLHNSSVDLIFLDIHMPQLKGFDFLKTLSNPPKVIVTTAYQEYALEGFELNVVDYLLKPFSFERFMKAVLKVNEQPNTNTQEKTGEEEERIFLKGDKKHFQIRIRDILFIESFGNYVKVHLNDEVLVTHERTATFEKILPQNQFIRVHKSFIIQAKKIESIAGNRIKIKDHQIPIGQVFKLNVMKLLKG